MSPALLVTLNLLKLLSFSSIGLLAVTGCSLQLVRDLKQYQLLERSSCFFIAL